jgi:hypothetical protein
MGWFHRMQFTPTRLQLRGRQLTSDHTRARRAQANLTQDNPFTEATNNLNINFVANVWLQRGTRLHLSGFSNISVLTDNPSSTLPVVGWSEGDSNDAELVDAAPRVEADVEWFARGGELIATVSSGLEAFRRYRFSVRLTNPSFARMVRAHAPWTRAPCVLYVCITCPVCVWYRVL